MAIFLDTTALPFKSQTRSLAFSVIRAVANQRGHKIFVPRLVLEEAVANRQREVEDAIRDLGRAINRLRKLGAEIEAPLLQEPAEAAEQWRRDLMAQVTVVETPDGAPWEALVREVWRLRPAREGKGARDTAIWLTVLNKHLGLRETSYFVSHNTRDFADPQDKGRLHPELAAQCTSVEYPLYYCHSSSALLAQLGEKLETPLTEDMLTGDDAVLSALIEYLSRPETLSKLLFDPSPGTLYVASPVKPTLQRLGAHEAYTVNNITVVVAWTHWSMDFSLGMLTTYGYRGFAQEILPVVVEGDFQLWIRREQDEASLSEAEVAVAENLQSKR